MKRKKQASSVGTIVFGFKNVSKLQKDSFLSRKETNKKKKKENAALKDRWSSLGEVAHISHPSYSGEIRKIKVQDQAGQKISETPSQQIGWAWWFTSPSYLGSLNRRITVQAAWA
jgi:hypothetical protein